MTAELKQMLLDKAKIYRRWKKRGDPLDEQALKEISGRCRLAIKEAKENYFSRLGNFLNDPNIVSKKYWSTLKKFLSTRKTPKVPPIRNNRNILVSDVSEKASICNSFFAEQCSLIDTGSILPPEQFLTDLRLENLEFHEDMIESLINSLNIRPRR